MIHPRTIFHVDMDAFFAAVEQLDHPQWRGKPVLVGGSGPRSVVATASYEARAFGCHSAQPMAVALRICPNAIIAPPRGSRYREIAQQLFTIYDDFSPLVQPISIDEAFLDMTGSSRLLGEPVDVATKLKHRIHQQAGLHASIGIAPNKFLAKLASDIEKPDGLKLVTPDMIESWLPTLPISRLWGVGPSTQRKLQSMNVHTIADVRALAPAQLTRHLGDFGDHLAKLARGQDSRKVIPDHEAKSIGQEQTFPFDVPHPDQIRSVILGQVEQVARRLRKHKLKARTVTLKIRYGDFKTITRSATLDEPADLTDTLWHTAGNLFDKWVNAGFQPVRLIGVTASQFSADTQLSLFPNVENDRLRRVDQAADQIVNKFGKNAIRRASPDSPSM